jgi:hypothetical protein
MLGQGSNGSTTGQQFGPRETSIINSKFYNIKQHAVYVNLGTGNTVRDCKFITVGNDGGATPIYPQIYFAIFGNNSQSNQSDRSKDLATSNLAVPYVPELGGEGSYSSYNTNQITLGYITSPVFAFRLPVNTTFDGSPHGSIFYTINYFYKSSDFHFTRSGIITISADIENAKIQLSDEYNFAGADDSQSTRAKVLDFSTYFLDQNGVRYTGAIGQAPSSIAINYSNTLNDSSDPLHPISDAGFLNYAYSSIFSFR